jgi:hypothetical protein
MAVGVTGGKLARERFWTVRVASGTANSFVTLVCPY